MEQDPLLGDVLTKTGADRVTLRLDVAGMNYPCVAEATAPGVVSIRADNSIDQRGAATATWVAVNRRTLVQPDLDDAVPAPPAGLLQVYSVKAQMLSPVLVSADEGEAVAGWISVHSLRQRPWSGPEIDALEAAASAVAADLDPWYGTTWQRPAVTPAPPYGPG